MHLNYNQLQSIIVTIDQFNASDSERAHLGILQDLSHSFLLKWASKDHNITFPSLKLFLHCVRKQCNDKEESKVIFCDILSEKADSKPTLLKVIDKLHKIFVCQLNHKFVIVVGDAKTYSLLVAITREYGEELNWLLPYPGDWHILLNYQKVVMKPLMLAC